MPSCALATFPPHHSASMLRAAEARALETRGLHRENNSTKVGHQALSHLGITGKGNPAQVLWLGCPMCKPAQLISFILPLSCPHPLA